MNLPKLSHHPKLQKGYLTFRSKRFYIPGKWPNGQKSPPVLVFSAYSDLVQRLLKGEDPEQAASLIRGEAENAIAPPSQITIAELVSHCLDWADVYYAGSSGEAKNLAYATPELLILFGETQASLFGCKKLKAVQAKMVATGASRQGINRRINLVRRIFKWGAGEELIPSTVADALKNLPPLRRGHCDAPESQRKDLVSDELVEATLPYLNPQVRAMVQLAKLTGMRPSEVCRMRTVDIDRADGDCWWFVPEKHKTALTGKTRHIGIGPQAIKFLEPWLDHDEPEKFLFRPKDVMRQIWRIKRETRKSKVQPSQVNRAKESPRKSPGEAYNTISLTKVIHKACDAAKIERWSPGQLRKSCAQKILRLVGIEPARAALGHSEVGITRSHYLNQEKSLAKEAMVQVG